jgi:hypothetical protein
MLNVPLRLRGDAPLIAVARGLVLAGAAAWLVGAWTGWFREEVSGEAVRPHHLATTGWVWLAALPLLLAAFAPPARRWLWPLAGGALVVLGATVVALLIPLPTQTEFPYMLALEERRFGLPLSIAGAALALAGLVLALGRAERGRAPRRHARLFAAAGVAALLAVSAVVLREDLAHEGREARIERQLRSVCEDEGAVDSVRVHCARSGWCAQELVIGGSVSSSRGYGDGATSYAPASC